MLRKVIILFLIILGIFLLFPFTIFAVTTTTQYNQTQTANVTGSNSTSPSNLNTIDGQTYNVTEFEPTQNNESSDQESGEQQFKGSTTQNTLQILSGNVTDDTDLYSARTTANGDVGGDDDLILFGLSSSNSTVILKFGGLNLIPGGVEIIDSQLGLYIITEALDAGEAWNMDVYHVYNNTAFNIGGSEWIEGTGTHTASCTATGAAQANPEIYYGNRPTTSSQMNLTYETRVATATGGAVEWKNWTVKNMVNDEYSRGNKNITFWINASIAAGSPAAADCIYFASAEDGTAANRPYLNVTYTTPETEENKTTIYYNDTYSGDVLINITNISVIVNVSAYNNTGSAGKNSNPDLWLEVWDGSIWSAVGNMTITGTGNDTIYIPNQDNIFDYWHSNPTQRNITIKGRYFDANSTSWDEINYTDVWVRIDSSGNYRAEIEHNATGVTWSGILNNISVSVNFTTNVTSDFNLTIYNFSSGSWNYTPCSGGTATANTWYTWWCNVTSNPSYYNSSDGKISIRLNGTAHAGVALIREDYVQYYVTSSTDNPPQYSNIQTSNPSVYSPTQQTCMNVTWTDDNGISQVRIESNYSNTPENYTSSQDGNVYYLCLVLPAGSHYWKSYANDTANQWNTSTKQEFTINNASNPVNLYLNGTLNSNNTYIYPQSVNATGTSTAGTVYLYRDNVYKETNEQILLGNGTYAYKVNATGNANYSDNTTGVTYYALVNKGNPDVKTFIDDANSNKTVSYPTSVTIKGNSTTTITPPTFNLYLEDMPLGSGNPVSQSITRGNGTYNVIYNTSGNGNWSSASNSTLYLLVNKGNPSSHMNLYIDGVADNKTIYYPNSANVSANKTTSGDADVTYTLWRNNTQLISGSDVWNQTQLGNGTYAFVYNTTGGSNWTSGKSTTYYLFVNKGYVNISLWLNGTENNRTYTQNQFANFTAKINVTGLTINLTSNYTGWIDIQNQTVIYNETNMATAGNFWNLTAFYPGGENYSSFSRTYFFNVTSDQPPTWSSNNTNPLSPTTYAPSKTYQFNIIWQDDFGVSEVILEFSGTNYSKLLGQISQDGNVYYKTLTDLPANETGYSYKWFANDTINQWSSTGSYWLYIINRNNSQNYMNLTINGTESNKEYMYPAGSNVTSWHSTPQLTFNLSRNDTLIGDGNPISDVKQFGVGFYVYVYNTSGNENYTSSSKNYNLTIQKNTTNPVRLFLNDNEDNITVTYPTTTNASGIIVYSDSGTADLYRNDSDANSENNTFITLGAAVYEYRVNTTGNDNYTANSTGVVYYLTVNKSSTNMSLWLNDTPDNYSYYQYNWANFTAQLNVSGKTIKLNSSYPGWSEISNDSVIYNLTQLNTLGNDFNLTAYWGGDDNYSADSQTYFFDVITNQPPYWSANYTSVPNGTVYTLGRNYGFQINWTDPETSVNIVVFEFNGTNYTDVSNNGENTYWYNLTDLPADTWNYTWYANDTQDAWGQSDRWNYTVNKVTSNAFLTILPSSPINYGTQSIATCTEDNLEANANLYRNDSLANSENNTYIILPAGTWEYICNVTSTQNYTSATNSSIYIIQQANPITNMHIAINGSETDQIKQYPNSTNITAWETNTNDDGCSYNFYRNDSSTTTPELLELGVGNYTYIYNTTGCTNYSSGSIIRILNITKGSSVLTLSNNLSWSGAYPSSSNTSGSGCPSELTCNLYRNDSGLVTNPNEILLGVGGYNYTYNTSGNQNYSANSTSNVLTIFKGIVNISLWLNDSESNRTYGINDIANFTAKSNVSGLTVNLSANMTGWIEPSGTTTVYNTTNLTNKGVFNITGYTTGNENYSSSSRTYYANVLGTYLEMELIEPTGTKLVKEGVSFLLNASIKCKITNCGSINITPRYNGNVINTTGILYVNESSRNCMLNKDEICFVNWTVYTTTIGTWNIDVNASNSVTNETSDATLSVYRVVTELLPGVGAAEGGVLPPLLDLEITNLTPTVFAGEDLVYTINLTNVGYNKTSFDVVIHKRVISDNKILLEDVITRSMISGLLVTDSLKIPEDFQFGRYFFELYVEYTGRNASALAVFDVKKSCIILDGASYDLSRRMLTLYAEDLRNVTLRFKNKCEIELTDGILWLDGNSIEIGKVPKEGFYLTVDFDKYGLHNATVVYKEGISKINFNLTKAGLEIYVIILVIAFIILVGIAIKKYGYRLKEIQISLRPKKVEENELELFKDELKTEIIKRLKKKLEEGEKNEH